MFDFGVGYSELFLLAVIAVIIIGPKDLPAVLRAFGRTVNKMRGMAREFQGHLDSAMRDAGLDEVKKEVQNIKSTVSTVTNPVGTIAKSAVADLKADVKKSDDDFKKFFGESTAKPEEPKKAPETTP